MAIFDIDGCESKIGYSFKDKMLLRTCFTHASYGHEHNEQDNELLEFFGDAIIQYIVTEHLFKNSMGDEGAMTKIRAELVSKEPLLRSIKNLGLDQFVLLGHGQEKSANHDEKLYSSIYEALCAGLYLDGGINAVKKFVKDTIIAEYESYKKQVKQPRTRCLFKIELQEHVQKYKLGSITYLTLSKKGPDHSPEFREAVLINGKRLAEGKGKSKQLAQNKAAESALKKLKQGR